MVIAVDGPAGAGKSTVCRRVAEELGFIYLDTGSMYRAVAWALLKNNIDPRSDMDIEQSLPCLPIEFAIESNSLSISYGGSGIADDLRNPETTRYASLVSQRKPVRDYLTLCQRKLAAMGNVVAEGRDMGTVVFPDAEVKVFLTANLETRTQRRLLEYHNKGVPMDYASLETQIKARDEADQSRSIAPLRAGEGVAILDSSHLNIDQVVSLLLTMASAALKEGDRFRE
ncbi:MAG: (d)CMP kinase [Syntrophobacteraceae bacterium]|nr:(d)CMP kinase [Syntrophobacteraceae bacterium]